MDHEFLYRVMKGVGLIILSAVLLTMLVKHLARTYFEERENHMKRVIDLAEEKTKEESTRG